MHTALDQLSSTVPWLIVHFHLKTRQQFVQSAEQIHDSHKLQDSLVIQALLPHRGSMDRDSVVASHHSGNGNRYDLLG